MGFNSAYDDSKSANRVTLVSGIANIGFVTINGTVGGGGGVAANYNSTATTYNSGASTSLWTDVNGNLKSTNATLQAGEDLTNDVQKVEQRFSYSNATVAGATAVHKSGAGFVHNVILSTISCPSIVFYDAVTATAPNFFYLPPNAAPGTYALDVSFSTGLTTKVSAGETPMVLVSYR